MHEAHSAGPFVRERSSSGPNPLMIGLAVALVASLSGVGILAYNLSTAKEATQQEARRADEKAKQAEKAAQAERNAAENARLAQQRFQQAKVNSDRTLQNERRFQQWEEASRQTQYVTQIRLAKQAWDRGDTSQVHQLLDPYRTDPAKQKLRNFAWYYLWRVTHSGSVNTLREHSQTVRQTAFMPDGGSAITLGDDGVAVLWDVASGKKLESRVLRQTVFLRNPYAPSEDNLAQQAGGLAISPDGWWTASYGNAIWLGDFRQSGALRRLGEHNSPIISMAMTRNGKLLATGDYQGEIILREVPDGRIVRRWKNPRPEAMAFTPQGNYLMIGLHDGGLAVWDVNTGALQGSASFGQEITSVAMTRDEQTAAVALADREGVVCLWDPATGKVRAELRGHHDVVTRVVFSPDGKNLVTTGRDHTACLWNTSGRLLKTFKGHLGEVETAAFSPDGQKILTGATDHTAILWDAESDQQCDALTDTPAFGWIQSLAFTPGSEQLIGAGSCETSDAFLTSWNLADSNRPISMQTSSRAGTALAFSADARLMAVGEGTALETASRSRVRIWDLETGRILGTLPKLAGTVNTTAFSPDGRLVAVALGDLDERTPGLVTLMDAATGIPRQTLPEMVGRVEAAFTPDGRLLVTVSSSKRRPGEIRLWSPATGQLVDRIENPRELDRVTATALSPNGQLLVTAHGDMADPRSSGGTALKLWDLNRKTLVAQFPAAHRAAITKLVFSRRGLLLASGSVTGEVRIWDFPARKLLPAQIPSQNRPITGMAFDVLGERIATGADERCVRVWHVDTARPLATLNLALGTPAVTRFTPDGKSLVATTTAGGLILWDAESYRPRSVLRAEGNPAGADGHAGRVTCAAVLPSEGKLLTGSNDKTVKLWDLKTGKFQSTLMNLGQAVSSMALSLDGRKLVIGTGKYRKDFEAGELILCDLDSRGGRPSTRVLFQGIAVTSLALTPDGNTLAVCSMTVHPVKGPIRNVALFNLLTGKAVAMKSNLPQSVAIAPDGRLLAIGCVNGEIDLWRIESSAPTEISPVVLQGHQGAVASLSFSPDGGTLASGGYDDNVKIWDIATREELLTFKQNGAVETVRFSPDGKILASADREALHGGIRLWHAAAETR